MKACLWIGHDSSGRTNFHCTELAGYKEVTLTDDFKCTNNQPCPHLYLRIQNVTSLYKCTGRRFATGNGTTKGRYLNAVTISEIDCKTPDQVRYIIRTNQQDMHYRNSANKNTMLIFQSILMSFILYFPMKYR